MSDVVDKVLEATVVGSFTNLGIRSRRRLFAWDDDMIDMEGRSVLVTGGTSGLGRAAAVRMASMGADVFITGRDPERGARAEREIRSDAGTDAVTFLTADMGDLAQVGLLADDLSGRLDQLDVLVHNAGALLADRQVTVDDMETTFQVHVVGPARLTHDLLPLLRQSADARVIWVSSGGMYSEKLVVDRVEMGPDDYDGTKAYARAKRAQVEMTPRWAELLTGTGVTAHVMHPGWADTPGVEASLPTFGKIVGPFLRTPAEGADTIVWLAAAPADAVGSGQLWHDRRVRSAHKVPWTRADDPDRAVDDLWSLVADRAGLDDLVGSDR